VHLFVLETRDPSEEFVADHEDEMAAAATHLDWFALPNNVLERYSTAGSPNKFNVNEGTLEDMAPYRNNARNVLG
jgi:hypothetical protein